MNSRAAIKIALIVVIAGAVAALYFSPARTYMTREHLRDAIAFMRSVPGAPLLLIAGYGIGCIFAAPASLFIIAAAIVWGWKLGAFYAMCGGMLGATLSYFVGRFLGEGLLTKFGKAGQVVEQRVKSAGLKTMIIIRLIPGPPFAVWNYGAGVAAVPFGIYFLGTLIGALPAHVIFAYSADALFRGTMTQGDAIRRLLVVAALLVFMVLLPTIIRRLFGVRTDDLTAAE